MKVKKIHLTTTAGGIMQKIEGLYAKNMQVLM